MPLRIKSNTAEYSFPDQGRNKIYSAELFTDSLSDTRYFFAKLPIEYLSHDDRINPRAIGSSLKKLVEEFFKKRPQLHISLAWVKPNSDGRSRINVFDGQHKAAAQVLLLIRELPVRIFVDPDLDILLTTNTNAGTNLRQVAFDKSIQRHLGSALYGERIQRYQDALGTKEYDFSEKDLTLFYKGEYVKRYILDNVRDGVTHHPENKLKDCIDLGGHAKERPLSYSSIEKTFYSFFIGQDVLESKISYKMDVGENPRQLEESQIIHLMNIIADEIFVKKFDTTLGTYQIEKKIQNNEDVPEEHLRAFRMSKEEVIYNWLKIVEHIVKRYFLIQGKPFDEKRLFQYQFPEALWDSLTKVIHNLGRLSMWTSKPLSSTVFGGKQNYDYWRTIFETGKSPQGLQVMPTGINLDDLLRD